jgi:hypothetical protein
LSLRARRSNAQETAELARKVMDALNQRDPSCLIAVADPEVEWHSFSRSWAKVVPLQVRQRD